jgi:ABC-2 type transport system permease protein
VVITLFPLVILGLSYNLLSSEREGGTLALVLSQPVRLRTIVLGKVLIRVVATLLVTVAIGWGAALVGAGGSVSDPAILGRWLGWLAVVAAYGAFWFALAVAVNALGRSSAANAVMLIAAWLAFALVIPSVINLVAAVAYPVPSRVELVQATRVATSEASAQGSRLLAQYFEDHPELAGASAGAAEDFAARAYTVQDAVERQVAPLLERFDEQLRRQHAVINWARFLSPSILAQGALQDIAGTGKARYAAYNGQIDAFHRQWRGSSRR